ncbi:MAG: BrnA antitoxin family protein, partial [Caulobacterales bacterium]|jgi:uncharacterized protein (DUF4415 family)
MSAKLSKAEIAAIEARMQGLPEPDMTDPDNPEWTEADFARAQGPESLPPEVLAAFPKTRGRGRPKLARPKESISMRLDAEVVEHLRGQGRGWQTRVNDALAGLIAKGRL